MIAALFIIALFAKGEGRDLILIQILEKEVKTTPGECKHWISVPIEMITNSYRVL